MGGETDGRPEGLRRRGRLVAAAVVCVLIAAGLAIGLTRGADHPQKLVREPPALTGSRQLPEIRGTDLAGKPLDLASFRGRPLFINVWGSWCLPCREEAPQILRFTKEHPEVAFVGVDYNDARLGNGAAFAREAGWTHPSLADPKGDIALGQLEVGNLPATYYVDARGVIRGRTPGPVTFEDLAGVAARLAAGG